MYFEQSLKSLSNVLHLRHVVCVIYIKVTNTKLKINKCKINSVCNVILCCNFSLTNEDVVGNRACKMIRRNVKSSDLPLRREQSWTNPLWWEGGDDSPLLIILISYFTYKLFLGCKCWIMFSIYIGHMLISVLLRQAFHFGSF